MFEQRNPVADSARTALGEFDELESSQVTPRTFTLKLRVRRGSVKTQPTIPEVTAMALNIRKSGAGLFAK
jgi:hypothetical protein